MVPLFECPVFRSPLYFSFFMFCIFDNSFPTKTFLTKTFSKCIFDIHLRQTFSTPIFDRPFQRCLSTFGIFSFPCRRLAFFYLCSRDLNYRTIRIQRGSEIRLFEVQISSDSFFKGSGPNHLKSGHFVVQLCWVDFSGGEWAYNTGKREIGCIYYPPIPQKYCSMKDFYYRGSRGSASHPKKKLFVESLVRVGYFKF